MTSRNILKSTAIAFTISIGLASAALAECNFEGETITIVVPFGEGGGTSQTFGFFQPYLQKYLPGNPLIQMLNVPGGGSIKGANQFHNNQVVDGTYLLATSTSTVLNQAAGNPLVEYDLGAYKPVALIESNVHWFTSPTVSATAYDLGPLKERSLNLFALNSPSSADMFHVWIINKLGLDNARPIPGLSSSNGYQAFLRGEIQLSSHGTANYLRQVKQGIDAGEITDLMTLGWIQPDGSIERVPYAPDTPTFAEQFETMTGAPLSDDDLDTYMAINAIWNQASKALFLPTEASDEIVQCWTNAFAEIVKDADFIAEAPNRLGPFPLIIGDDARPVVARATSLSDGVVDQLNNALKANRLSYRIER
jgi:tripartite-type tricarboxylate transporter receptor subunit TctC